MVNLLWVPMDEALGIRRTPGGFIVDPTAKTNGRGFPFVTTVG